MKNKVKAKPKPVKKIQQKKRININPKKRRRPLLHINSKNSHTIKKTLKHALRRSIILPLNRLLALTKKYLHLFLAWLKLKDIGDISKKQFEIGEENLNDARKSSEKEVGKHIVKEFEAVAKQKAKEMRASPRAGFKARVFLMKRIKANLLKLLHPIKLLRKTRKTKTVIYTDGWEEVNNKGKSRL